MKKLLTFALCFAAFGIANAQMGNVPTPPEFKKVAFFAGPWHGSVVMQGMLAFNAYIEIDGYYLPWLKSKQLGLKISGAKESCSAFVATGSQTRDGKIVMGHNLWWSYPTGQRFNAMRRSP